MNTGTIVGLVVGFVVVDVVVMQTLLRTGVLKSSKERYQKLVEELRATAAQKNESIVRGPEWVNYSGATGGGFSGVHNRALAMLTPQRLIIKTPRGNAMDLEREAIQDVRAEKWFRTSASASRTHVVLRMKGDFEIGFSVVEGDETTWLRDIGAMLAA
jgi:hypothetical protein